MKTIEQRAAEYAGPAYRFIIMYTTADGFHGFAGKAKSMAAAQARAKSLSKHYTHLGTLSVVEV
jgi:hypothetical protein